MKCHNCGSEDHLVANWPKAKGKGRGGKTGGKVDPSILVLLNNTALLHRSAASAGKASLIWVGEVTTARFSSLRTSPAFSGWRNTQYS